MDLRQQQLSQWLQDNCNLPGAILTPLTGDASFRRYFRVHADAHTTIAMDAPPERESNTAAFIALARGLRARGLRVPEIIANDNSQGFLLLSDFGDQVYLRELTTDNADILYSRALTALSQLQACQNIPDWPLSRFSAEFMYRELQTFKEWFLLKHLNLTLSSTTETMLTDYFYFLANTCAEQPQVFMHRDYHAGNLMVLPDNNVGILDFQDAFIGPVTYDLVSLLRDCYIVWPATNVRKWALQYKNSLATLNDVDDNTFMRWFDIMGMQRHLKALLTFSRKFHRDKNADYLWHIPRTLDYVINVAPHYPECVAFADFLDQTIVPSLAKVAICAE
jgi:N-acetylmuramate 1-kinase